MARNNKRRRIKRDSYRLALRTVPEWNDPDRMDDVVIKDVGMFRMEQMDLNNWWICCYLDDGPESDAITFHARYDHTIRQLVVRVTEHAGQHHTYEDA